MDSHSNVRPECDQVGGMEPGERRRALSVLVVEDDQDSAELMATILEFEGCRVQVALDGPSALATAQKFLPDAVLLDIGLPGMSGYELAHKLHEVEALRHAALIAVTGFARDEDRSLSAESGFSYYLVKPVDLDELRAILTKLSAAR